MRSGLHQIIFSDLDFGGPASVLGRGIDAIQLACNDEVYFLLN